MPVLVTLATLRALVSVIQRFPSGPATIPLGSLSEVGAGYSVIVTTGDGVATGDAALDEAATVGDGEAGPVTVGPEPEQEITNSTAADANRTFVGAVMAIRARQLSTRGAMPLQRSYRMPVMRENQA